MREIQLANESGFGLRSLRGAGGLKIQLLPDGSVYSIERGPILINQILSSPVAGGVHRIYLRIHAENDIRALCVVGPESRAKVTASADAFVWSGEDQQVRFRCTCTIHPARDAWFFRIEAENKTAKALR